MNRPIDGFDLMFGAGCALVVIGAGMIYLPVGVIVAGVILIVFAVVIAAARSGGRKT